MRRILKRCLVSVLAFILVMGAFFVPFIPTASAAPTFVQASSNHNTASTSIGCTLGSTVTAGDSIFFMSYSTNAINVDSYADGLSTISQGFGANSVTLNSALYTVAEPQFSSAVRAMPGFTEQVSGASDTITTPISGGSSSTNAIVCAEFTGGFGAAANVNGMTTGGTTGTTTSTTISAPTVTPTSGSNLVMINLMVVGCNGISSVTLPAGFTAAVTEVAQSGGTTGCAAGWKSEAILAYDIGYAGGASTFTTTVVSVSAPSISEAYNAITVSSFVLNPVVTTTTLTSTITSTITTTINFTSTITNTITSTITNTVTSTITHTTTLNSTITSTVTTTTTVTSGGGAACAFSTNFTVCFAVSPPGGGSTVPSVPISNITSGTVISIAATPNPGYVFVSWTSSAPTNTIASPTSASTTSTIHTNGVLTANFAFIGLGKPSVYFVEVVTALLVMAALDFTGWKLKRGGGVFWIASLCTGIYTIGQIYLSGYIVMDASLITNTSVYVLNPIDPNLGVVLMVIATLASSYLIYWDYFVDS